MYDGYKVIDIHGHLTAPVQYDAFGFNLIIGVPQAFAPFKLTDDQLNTATSGHIKVLDDRNIDVQFLSARPFSMLHWERPYVTQHWTKSTNDLIAQTVRMYPDRFRGVAGLPQQWDTDTSACLDELNRCVNELGFIAAVVNPDPSGEALTPKLNDEYWYPLYARAQELDIPLIIHGSAPRGDQRLVHGYDETSNPQMDRQFYFMMEHTMATMILERGHVFQRFPRLKIVVIHCGGAPSRFVHRDEEPLAIGNLFFDTCAYEPAYLSTSIHQRGVERMVFGTESPGAGSNTTNPATNRPSDDLVTVISGFDFLSAADKRALFHDNPLKLFNRAKVE